MKYMLFILFIIFTIYYIRCIQIVDVYVRKFYKDLSKLKKDFIPHSEYENLKEKYKDIIAEYYIVVSINYKEFKRDYINLEAIIDKHNEIIIRGVVEESIKNFYNDLNKLKKEYISYSECEKIKEKYKNIINEYNNFISKNYSKFKKDYINLEAIIDKYNDDYVEKELINNKEYFDTMFKYPIDDDQRNAIVIDDDYNLVIASAGSGKTTTMIGKVKYLIEKKNVASEKILVLSFSNSAVNNFKERLDNENISVKTFHSLGCEILKATNRPYKYYEKDYLKRILIDYLENNISKDIRKIKNFIHLIAYYLYIPKYNNIVREPIDKNLSLETFKSKIEGYKNGIRYKTLNYEYVKSNEELVIANYLYLNGINYEYEKEYEHETKNEKYSQYRPDFYLTDYDIYLEHFGFNEEFKTPQYSKEDEEKYIETYNYKKELHKEKNTKMLETYSYYFKQNIIFDKLEEMLNENGIKYNPKNENEVFELIKLDDSEEINSLKTLIETFINKFKSMGYTEHNLDEFIMDAYGKSADREYLLFSLIKRVYDEYEKRLKDENYIDFNDMILNSIEVIKNNLYLKKYDYIIVDEFQDISLSRLNLLNALKNMCDAKIVAVGDDWQSIYGYSSADVNLIVDYNKSFKHPKKININTTYRNSQELVDIAANFIQKNEKGQLKKKIKSKYKSSYIKPPNQPVDIIYYEKYDDILGITCDKIKELINEGCKTIAILGRNNSDINKYVKGISDKTNLKEIKLNKYLNIDEDICKIIFTTVHKSKGLEYDGVIICNNSDFIAGFPNKIEDDPILNYVSVNKDNYPFSEERRLFYVALTRTKERCILLVPKDSPSEFVIELLDDNKKLINVSYITTPNFFKCDRCGGYMRIIKTKNNENFLACSNYLDYGCNNTISGLKEYFELN